MDGFTATRTRWNQQCSGETPRLINGCGKSFVLVRLEQQLKFKREIGFAAQIL